MDADRAVASAEEFFARFDPRRHTFGVGVSIDRKGNNGRGGSHKYTDFKKQYMNCAFADMHVNRFYNCHGNATLADMECMWMAAAKAAGFRLHNLNEGGANVDVFHQVRDSPGGMEGF